MRQTGDQVHVDIRNSCATQTGDVIEHDVTLMQTPNRSGFVVYERLHSQADAVYARMGQSFDLLFRKRARRAFHCDLSLRLQKEILPNRDKNTFQL